MTLNICCTRNLNVGLLNAIHDLYSTLISQNSYERGIYFVARLQTDSTDC